MYSAVGSTGLHPRTTAYCNSDGRFAQIASWQYCSMAWPALLPDGTDPDVGQQTNTDLHRSLLDLRGTRSCAERVLLAFGELRQTNIDLGLAGNARIVANAADPFDTPEQIVIRERINCVKSLAHWQIITESESIKEPRGRSRSQNYSQIALLHSHLFLHDQLTFADISGTDNSSNRLKKTAFATAFFASPLRTRYCSLAPE